MFTVSQRQNIEKINIELLNFKQENIIDGASL